MGVVAHRLTSVTAPWGGRYCTRQARKSPPGANAAGLAADFHGSGRGSRGAAEEKERPRGGADARGAAAAPQEARVTMAAAVCNSHGDRVRCGTGE